MIPVFIEATRSHDGKKGIYNVSNMTSIIEIEPNLLEINFTDQKQYMHTELNFDEVQYLIRDAIDDAVKAIVIRIQEMTK